MTAAGYQGDSVGAARAFAEAHRQLLADNSIQFDPPLAQLTNVPAGRYAPPNPSVPAPSLADPAAAGASPIPQILLWSALAVVLLLLLYWIARRLADARRKPPEGEEKHGWHPEPAPALVLLGEADALAGEVLYGEAARLLLFRSIEDIDARRPDLLRPALTSRDIAGLPALPSGPRAAFARIAMAVERSLFGRRALGADDWRDCRAAYEEFAFAESWGG